MRAVSRVAVAMLVLVPVALADGCKGGRSGLSREQILVMVEEIDDAARAGDKPAVASLAAQLDRLGPEAFALTVGLLDSSQPRVVAVGVALLTAPEREEAFELAVRETVVSPPGGPFAVRARVRALGAPAIAVLSRLFGDMPSPYVRRNIIEAAAEPPGSPSLGLVWRGLSDENADVRLVAARTLGEWRAERAFEELTEMVRSPFVLDRAIAIDGLQALGDPWAVANLVEILEEPDRGIFFPLLRENRSNHEEPYTLHGQAATAIDVITGEKLGGDVVKIRDWIERHRARVHRLASPIPGNAGE